MATRSSTSAATAGAATCQISTAADSQLTPIQYAHMQRWKDGNYTNDWAGVPAPQADVTPDGLDRAALEACVGGAFFPGIEAGGLDPRRPARSSTAPNYAEASGSTTPSSRPGASRMAMALPWQADF